MPVIPATWSQVLLGFTGSGVPHGAAVTFGVDNTVNDTPLAIAQFVRDSTWLGDMMDNFTNDISVTQIRVKNGPNDTGPFAELVTDIPGGSTAAGSPPNLAILIEKHTAFGGRSNQGRWYWPGVQEAAVDEGGNVLNTFATGLQGTLDDGLTEFDVGSHAFALLHSESAPSTTPRVITAFAVDPVAATQRRRMR